MVGLVDSWFDSVLAFVFCEGFVYTVVNILLHLQFGMIV